MIRFGIAALLVSAACGLVSSDITRLPLRLPEKSFTIDATAWKVPAGDVPAVPCAAGCASAKATLCGTATCSADCDGTNCQAHVTLAVTQDYDLSKESSDYQAIGSQSLVSFGVDAIAVKVSSNSLTFATPALTLYLAPATATGADDPSAEVVGTLAPIPAGQVGTFNVSFVAGGQDVLKKYMLDNYKTPFRAIVSGTQTVRAGDTSPTGKLIGAVVVTAHASLGT